MRIKCVVNNTEGKEARKQGRQESKAGAKEAKCVVIGEGEEAPETPRFRRSRDTREQDDLLLCEALWFKSGR